MRGEGRLGNWSKFGQPLFKAVATIFKSSFVIFCNLKISSPTFPSSWASHWVHNKCAWSLHLLDAHKINFSFVPLESYGRSLVPCLLGELDDPESFPKKNHQRVYHIKRLFSLKLRPAINGETFRSQWRIIYQAQLMGRPGQLPEHYCCSTITRKRTHSAPSSSHRRSENLNYLRLFSNQWFATAPSFQWTEHNSLERNRVLYFDYLFWIFYLPALRSYTLESNHKIKSLNYIFA